MGQSSEAKATLSSYLKNSFTSLFKLMSKIISRADAVGDMVLFHVTEFF